MATDSTRYDAIREHFESSAYELLEVIGEGGFGRVYRAQQANTGQIVAIKFLSVSSEYDDAKKKRYIERFERETQLCSRLQHPNIVRLLDKGRFDDDQLYAVFEYVEGKTLKQTLAGSDSLTAVETAEVMGQVLDALVHAHAEGVIHRDIKPANIILTKTGAKTHAKVLDFGIGTLANEARHLDYQTLTLTQETLGTPSYSAPEQLRGEPPTVKTDLYVWALVFIECLIKQPAISGSNVASIFHKQLSASNVPLPAAIVGHPIAALLRRALQKKVHERTVTAEDLYNELNQLNFANLVGDLSPQGLTQGGDINATTRVGEQDTIISTNAAAFTGLTERKQITALAICLQVRKTTSRESLDTEIIDALHHDQKNQCADIAVRYGATQVGILGDTLLFYFGYPSVSDNDPRLCARAALDIISGLAKRNSLLKDSHGIAMQARLGINTGIVTTYSDAAPEGDTPNIALELARCADIDHILCSDTSRKILEPYIEFEVANALQLGINAEEVATFKLSGERQVEAFGFLRGTRRNDAFIGRDTELAELIELLTTGHTDSQNKLAHVHGEAGIGKSRLVFELRDKAKDHHHYVAQCLPEHQNNALYPILNLLKYKYSLDALSTEKTQALLTKAAVKIEGANEGSITSALPILFTWLNIPLPEGMEPSPLAPDVQKQHLFKALSALFKVDSSTVNTQNDSSEQSLYIFEDMHWADPTSVEFISQFAQSLKGTPHVFISTSRQPLPEMLSGQGFNDIEVNKLSTEATTKFIVTLFDNEKVSSNVLDVLISRTDGIPLFIEELINMLQQKSLTHKLNGIIDFVSPDKLDEVPTNLRDSLQQKLDTLVYSKETAQLAATIGREFDYDLLIAASNHSEGQVQSDLDELVEADLIIQQRKVDGDSYIFKHALVRDAAYETLSSKVRKSSHLRLSAAITNSFPLFVERQPLELARHLALSDNFLSAVDYGLTSIKKQINSFSYNEALITRDIVNKWADSIDGEENIFSRKLSLYEALLPAALSVEGFSSNKASSWTLEIESYNKIGEIDKYPELSRVLVKMEWIKLANLHYSSQRDKAKEFGEYLLSKYKENEFNEFRMLVLSVLGQIYQFSGDLKKSIASFEKSLSIYDKNTSHNVSLEYGYDFYPTTLAFLSLSYIHVGRLDDSISAINDAVAYAERNKSKNSIMIALNFKALFYSMLSLDDQVCSVANYYNKTHYDEREPIFYKVYMDIMHSAALCDTDKSKKLIINLVNSGQNFATGWYFHLIAKKMLSLNAVDAAIEMMMISFDEAKKSEEHAVLPIIKHALAMCYFKKDGFLSKRVEQSIIDAIELSQSQEAHYLEYNSRKFISDIDSNRNICKDEKRIEELRYLLIEKSSNTMMSHDLF